MFISKAEKKQLQNTFELLQTQMKMVKNDISIQRELINNHRELIKKLIVQLEPPKKPRKKHTMSPETRARMSQMMKDRHAKNRLEKQNANSVSTTSV
jgi:hypothetical protein